MERQLWDEGGGTLDEMSWDEARRDEMIWDEMIRGEIRCDETRGEHGTTICLWYNGRKITGIRQGRQQNVAMRWLVATQLRG